MCTNYFDTASSLQSYSKDKATSFNADIAYNNNDDNFKSFDYKTKLLPNTIGQPAPNNNNDILKYAAIAVS